MSKRGEKLKNRHKRGSRRAAAARNTQGKRKRLKKTPKQASESGIRKWFKRGAIWGGGLAILGVLALAVAVGVAQRSIPSFYQLKATQNAQTILVRARDGTEIVELGPSYGEWLDFDQIPVTMKNAMIAVEDRRYHSHFGVDPIRLTGAIIELSLIHI